MFGDKRYLKKFGKTKEGEEVSSVRELTGEEMTWQIFGAIMTYVLANGIVEGVEE